MADTPAIKAIGRKDRELQAKRGEFVV